METSASGTNTVYELDMSGQPMGLTNEASTPTTQYLTGDGNKNVTTATSTSAALACTVRYDPFGSPVQAQSASNPCSSGSTYADLLYKGARRDTTTGDYQLGSRLYDPTKASFLMPDSYRTGQSNAAVSVGVDPLTRNSYSYVNGDPVNLSDPTGHSFTTGCEPDCGSMPQTVMACEVHGACLSATPSPRSPAWIYRPPAKQEPVPQLPPEAGLFDPAWYMQQATDYYGGATPSISEFGIPEESGEGQVVINVFIMGSQVCAAGVCLRADNRGFSSTASPVDNRAFIILNYNTGEGYIVVNPTCAGTSRTSCQSAWPLWDASQGQRRLLDVNYYQTSVSSQGAVNVSFSLVNASPLTGLSPTIDDSFQVSPSNHSGLPNVRLGGSGDRFPSVEAYQYLLNQTFTLGQFQQTNPGDLFTLPWNQRSYGPTS